MLNLLLSIPKDVVRGKIVSCLDLVSLVRLDTAATSHEHRHSVLDHILAGAEIDKTIEHSQEAVRWLLSRDVGIDGMIFRAHVEDADLDAASSVFTKFCKITLYSCPKLSVKAIHGFLSSCNWLSNLDFNNCIWLTDDILRVVAEHHPYLYELTVFDAPLITDEGAAHLASCCRELGNVHLKDCAMVGDVFIRQLGRCDVYGLWFTECPEISEEALIDFISEAKENFLHFTVSDNLRITHKTLQALARFCPLLEALSVDGCENIDEVGFVALIPVCQQLSFLSTNSCSFSTAALDVMSASISPQLVHLCITECDAFCDQHIDQITARAANIEELHIGYCPQLTDQALVNIGNRLSCLEELKVQACSLFDHDGFVAVAHGCPKLRLLDVAFCQFFNNKCLHEIVTHCTQLSELYVSDVKRMSAVSMRIVAEHCLNLTEIDIGYTSVTEAAVSHLILGCPKLTYIGWEDRASVGDALQELATQRKITLALDTEL